MSVYEDSGWYEAAGKLEPELHTGHGLSTELVVTRGEEARKRLQELAAHDLLFGEFHFTLFDPCYSHGDDIVKFAIRHHELMEKHKETNFSSTSQNHTVSSGVEGAHKGTTADKSGAARCHVCGCDVRKNGACASCGEPEKLNNAQGCKRCADGNVPEWSADASAWIHRSPTLDRRCDNGDGSDHDEGEYVRPPANPSQELSFVGDPQNVAYICFGGKYYTANHQECIENLLAAITKDAAETLGRIVQLGKDFDCSIGNNRCGNWNKCRVHHIQMVAQAELNKLALAESSLSSPPPKCRHCPSRLGEHHVHNCAFWGQVLPSECLPETTVRQSPSLSESGAESAHSGKQNTADKSELLPTQLPKEK